MTLNASGGQEAAVLAWMDGWMEVVALQLGEELAERRHSAESDSQCETALKTL